MRVAVTTEERLKRTSAGRIVTAGPCGYDFWTRYLDVFEQVTVVARVERVASAEGRDVEGPGVDVAGVPAYQGPWAYLLSRSRALGILRGLALPEATVVRAPSPIGGLLLSHQGAPRPYGLEVVADPLAVFGGGAVRHPLRVVFKWWFTRQLRDQCLAASAVAYVSRDLQERYPAGARCREQQVYSSIELPSSLLAAQPRGFAAVVPPWRLVTVGSLEQAYKGVDVLLEAVAACRNRGLPVRLTVIGDGRERPRLEEMTRQLALGPQVTFLGQLPGPTDVLSRLDAADLFVLASRTEGLPRALVEAMARALPCIATRVGGIPELLASEDLVPPGDGVALTEKLVAVLASPERLTDMSHRNLSRSRQYTSQALRPRRRAFYEAVKAATESMLAAAGR